MGHKGPMNSVTKAIMSPIPLLLTVALVLLAARLVTTYSYKNCVEEQSRNQFFCYRRREGNMSEFVKDLPESAIRLIILHNVIERIPNRSFFNLSNLTQLCLTDNQIETINEGAFLNLHRLQMLDLAVNNISHLEPFLFQDLHNLRRLDLAQNKIKVLPGHIFTTVLKLEILILEKNELFNFSQIAASVCHLQSLRTIRLSFNKLASLEHGNTSLPQSLSNLNVSSNNLSSLGCHLTFLSHLKSLNLSLNSRLQTEAFQGVDLAQLKYLSMQATNVNIIDFLNISNVRANSVDFSGTGLNNDTVLEEFCKVLGSKVDKVTNMNLSSNKIHGLSPTSLQYCPKHIERLDLSINRLKTTNCLSFLNHTKNLKVFKAEHNLINALEPCMGKGYVVFQNLTSISYRYNYILTVRDNAFYHTPNLVSLHLNINTIARLGRRALQSLRKLKYLRLDNNLLTDLFQEYFQNLSDLETLNLRSNRISVIFNFIFKSLKNLKKLDLGGNKITHIKKMGLHGLTSLTKLLLDDNNLKTLDTSLYNAFSDQLKVLNLKSNQFHYIGDTTISPFLNLGQLTELNLDRQQPYGLILLPRYFFRGLHSLKWLSLRNNRISRIAPNAFDDLTQLNYLNLDFCCIGAIKLQPGVFKSLRNLTRLIVENMGLQNFSKNVFGNLTKLQALQLNRNVMHSIDVDSLESLTSLTYMDMRDVPLSCNCKNSQLQNWTVTNPTVQVVNLLDHPCQESTKHLFYNFDTNVCYVDLGLYLCFTTAAVVILFTVFPIVFVKLYWTLKYSYFVFRAWFGEKWRRLRDEEENCAYDAFISYNSSDEQWVMEQLVPNLEGNGSSFKLCLHHRDFEVGRNIVDNIVSAVYSSRKTICVVSRNFLRSEWCSLEIQLASYRLFDEHRDVLLLVFLEHITEKQMSSYHRMRKVMLKKTYLQWPDLDCTDPIQAQKLFWSQLRRAMKANSQCENDPNKSQDSSHNRARHSESEMSDDTQYLLP